MLSTLVRTSVDEFVLLDKWELFFLGIYFGQVRGCCLKHMAVSILYPLSQTQLLSLAVDEAVLESPEIDANGDPATNMG